MMLPQAPPTLFPYTTLFRSALHRQQLQSLGPCPEHRRSFAPVKKLLGQEGSSQANDQDRSEEHTSELQSRGRLVCRLLLEKKNICKLATQYVWRGNMQQKEL